MAFNRISVSEKDDIRLRNLKAKTGLTPNLLCRLGLCLSLAEPTIPDPELYADVGFREFNRYTLTGPYDLFFFSLLRERLHKDGLDLENDLEVQFKAHLSRGILMLSQRLRNIVDLSDLIVEAQKRAGYPEQNKEVLAQGENNE